MSSTGGGMPKLKLKFGSAAAAPSQPVAPAEPSSETPKKKRTYNKKPKADAASNSGSPATEKKAAKKRPRDDDADEDKAVRKQPKLGLNLSLLSSKPDSVPSAPAKLTAKLITKPATGTKIRIKPSSQKLSLVSKSAGGYVFERKKGTGYDSEAEDVEYAPLIEHQFVVRMPPGEDCDYLRNAITEREIGTHAADVKFRFFDRDGRRAMVSIRRNHYAASIVDMPCIIEGHKSWDRKNFYKTADIHQMLVVTKKVKDADEARKAPLPEGIDEKTWQYPHGLTPPMHWVRKRRFRKRVSKRTIEAVEEEVERLLALDGEATLGGGTTTAELFDPNARDDDGRQSMEIDAEGEVEDSIEVDEEVEEDEFARLMEAELEGGDDQAILPGTDVVASPDTLHPTTETPEVPTTPSSAADTPDDEFGDSEDDMDEDERAAQQEMAQMREEADAIKKEIDAADKQIAAQNNRILKQKLQEKRAKLMRDWEIKKANLGESVDDED
jgi:transcription initiation factor TFIID subunit 7